jgi:hypothetical protein
MRKSFKITVSLATLLATSSLAMGTAVFAAPSIASFIPEGLKTTKNNSNIATVALSNVNTSAYENEAVQESVEKFNDEDSVTSVSEFVESVSSDGASEYTSNSGATIDVDDYDALTPLFDIVDADSASYDMDGSVEVSFQAEVAKEMAQDDLVILQVNPTSGEVEFIEPTDYDPATGEITATFDELGPFTILKNVSEADDEDANALAQLDAVPTSNGGNGSGIVNVALADSTGSTSSHRSTAGVVSVLASLLAVSGVVLFKKRCKD